MNFKNKTIWLTGASSGVGEALAKRLAQLGAKLILTSRNAEKLGKLKANLACAEKHDIQVADLTERNKLKDLVENIRQRHHRIDVLINNAGISQRCLALDAKDEVEELIFELDYWAPVTLTKHVLPMMLERQQGLIINISSLTGKISSPGRSSYSAAKHALIAYMDCLRTEIEGNGVRIINVCPGFVKTHISENALTANMQKFSRVDDEIKRGMTAEVFVDRLLKKLPSHDEIVIAQGLPLMGYYIYRISPALYRVLLSKTYKRQDWQKEQPEKE